MMHGWPRRGRGARPGRAGAGRAVALLTGGAAPHGIIP